jgi:hypothetical protein
VQHTLVNSSLKVFCVYVVLACAAHSLVLKLQEHAMRNAVCTMSASLVTVPSAKRTHIAPALLHFAMNAQAVKCCCLCDTAAAAAAAVATAAAAAVATAVLIIAAAVGENLGLRIAHACSSWLLLLQL